MLQVPGAHGHGKKAGLSKIGPSGKAKLGQTGGASSSRDVVAAHNRTVGGGGALPEGLSFGVGNVGSCSAMHESELSMSGVKAGTLSSGYGLPASGASKNNTYKSYQSPYGTGKRTTDSPPIVTRRVVSACSRAMWSSRSWLAATRTARANSFLPLAASPPPSTLPSASTA